MAGKKSQRESLGGFVYSTNPDFTPPQEDFESSDTLVPGKQNLRIWLERLKGDKKATVIKNYSGPESELEALAKILRTKCSCGGTVKEGNIILQGDVRTKAAEVLKKEGYNFKLAGG
jgi:translation initiation factor 1